ncbi:AraC family transcriptional regulator [Verrucomicrobiaceae bacterium 227]
MTKDFPAIEIPIERVVLVDDVVRPEAVSFCSASTPEHLIHVILSGEVRQSAGGQVERFCAGDVVWYHDAESVEGEILKPPWRFITIGFTAPGLSPPGLDRRVLPGGPRTIPLACEILEIWRNVDRSALERSLLGAGKLVELLLDFAPLAEFTSSGQIYPANAGERWWGVEKMLRLRLDEAMSLAEIANLAGMSERTLNRVCKATTGSSPVQRLRELRLTHARGLLQYTGLQVTEIAFRVGYARVQEFSRDFKKRYEETPREARQGEADYREIEREG